MTRGKVKGKSKSLPESQEALYGIIFKKEKLYEFLLTRILSRNHCRRSRTLARRNLWNFMIWSRLKQNRCPIDDCGKSLQEVGMLSDFTFCSDALCLFKIDTKKLDKMVVNMRRKEVNNFDPDENLSALNNL